MVVRQMMSWFMIQLLKMNRVMLLLLHMNRHRKRWHLVALFPRMVVISVMWLVVTVKIVRIGKITALMEGCSWFQVFVIEVELCVLFSHLVRIF